MFVKNYASIIMQWFSLPIHSLFYYQLQSQGKCWQFLQTAYTFTIVVSKAMCYINISKRRIMFTFMIVPWLSYFTVNKLMILTRNCDISPASFGPNPNQSISTTLSHDEIKNCNTTNIQTFNIRKSMIPSIH